MVINNFHAKRAKIEQGLLKSPERQFYSPIYLSQYRVTLPLIRKYAAGKLIDLGCGEMPYKELIQDQIESYDGLDFFPKTEALTYTADIQNMEIVKDESYQTAICLEVLEHVPNPFLAIQEIYRILKPEGVLIASVPHLSRLHDEPHDYFRFTSHGLRFLLEAAGFSLLEVRRRGGLFSFLGHQVSTLLLGLVWDVPGLKQVGWFLNSYLVTRACFKLDQIVDRKGIFAAGYTVVAQKKAEFSDNHSL